MTENNFIAFPTMMVNRHEILAVVPQLDEEKKTFNITAISKNGISLLLLENIETWEQAFGMAQEITKTFDTGILPQFKQQEEVKTNDEE